MKDQCSGVKCHKDYWLIYLTVPLCKRHWGKFCNIKDKEWSISWKEKVIKLIGTPFYKKMRKIHKENKKVMEYMSTMKLKNKRNKTKKVSKKTKLGNTKSIDPKHIKRK